MTSQHDHSSSAQRHQRVGDDELDPGYSPEEYDLLVDAAGTLARLYAEQARASRSPREERLWLVKLDELRDELTVVDAESHRAVSAKRDELRARLRTELRTNNGSIDTMTAAGARAATTRGARP